MVQAEDADAGEQNGGAIDDKLGRHGRLETLSWLDLLSSYGTTQSRAFPIVQHEILGLESLELQRFLPDSHFPSPGFLLPPCLLIIRRFPLMPRLNSFPPGEIFRQ